MSFANRPAPEIGAIREAANKIKHPAHLTSPGVLKTVAAAVQLADIIAVC